MEKAIAESREILAGEKKPPPPPGEPERLKWRAGETEYYIESDRGHRVSRGGPDDARVYSAWTPQKQLLDCFKGEKAKERAMAACSDHYFS